MNTKRNYKFVSMSHAYAAYDESQRQNAAMLSMLGRILDDSRTPDDTTYVMYQRSIAAEARDLIAQIKGE